MFFLFFQKALLCYFVNYYYPLTFAILCFGYLLTLLFYVFVILWLCYSMFLLSFDFAILCFGYSLTLLFYMFFLILWRCCSMFSGILALRYLTIVAVFELLNLNIKMLYFGIFLKWKCLRFCLTDGHYRNINQV